MTKQELVNARELAYSLLYSMVENGGKPSPKVVCAVVSMVEDLTYSIEAEMDMAQERQKSFVIKVR